MLPRENVFFLLFWAILKFFHLLSSVIPVTTDEEDEREKTLHSFSIASLPATIPEAAETQQPTPGNAVSTTDASSPLQQQQQQQSGAHFSLWKSSSLSGDDRDERVRRDRGSTSASEARARDNNHRSYLYERQVSFLQKNKVRCQSWQR